MHWAFFWTEQQGHEVVEFSTPPAVRTVCERLAARTVLSAVAVVAVAVVAVAVVVCARSVVSAVRAVVAVFVAGDKHRRIVADVHAFIGPFGHKPI